MQQNRYDCGTFVVYNADCLAFDESPSVEEPNVVQLKYNDLVRLRMLEIQGKMERHLVYAVLDRGHKFKFRKVPDEIADELLSPRGKPQEKVTWSHLGPAQV